MKFSFLYSGPHFTHAAWAESVGAEFVSNRIESYRISNLSRLMKSLTVINKIPKDTDILICEGGSDIIAGHRWKKRNPEKKLVFIVDDPKVYYVPKMNKIKRKLYERAMNSVDLFVAPTELMKSYIPLKHHEKTRIAELFLDYDRYFYEKTDITSKTIVFVGLLCKEKGADRILRAFKKVNMEFPQSKIFLVGDGPLKGKTTENIIFAGWQTNPKDYLVKGSIYINLARLEPAGVAVLEGMAAGLVPIITGQVGFKYVVGKVSQDLIVADENQAADMIINLWKNKTLMKKYSEKSREAPKYLTKERSIKMFKKALKFIE